MPKCIIVIIMFSNEYCRISGVTTCRVKLSTKAYFFLGRFGNQSMEPSMHQGEWTHGSAPKLVVVVGFKIDSD